MTMKKALSTAFVFLLLLVTVSGALAEKNVLITVAGDCTIGGEGTEITETAMTATLSRRRIPLLPLQRNTDTIISSQTSGICLTMMT